MAGIGPISTDRRDILKRAEKNSSLTVPNNELEIFLNLCVGRVYYLEQSRNLYFVDSPALSVTEIIHNVFKGMGQVPRIRQLYMDEHNLLKAAYSITLNELQKKRVMVALSLNGIHIKQA
jgi:hypothetical protein